MGALLVVAGAYGMWFGWGIILNERGWSSFIAGAAALSSGVVTIAIGRVIAHLARLEPPPPPRPEAAPRPAAKAPEAPEAAPKSQDPPKAEAFSPQRANDRPTEVDRYANGDEIYTMFSDGSVEVSGPNGFRRYPSIAALRADAEAKKR